MAVLAKELLLHYCTQTVKTNWFGEANRLGPEVVLKTLRNRILTKRPEKRRFRQGRERGHSLLRLLHFYCTAS